jgi:WD40 repeat protein
VLVAGVSPPHPVMLNAKTTANPIARFIQRLCKLCRNVHTMKNLSAALLFLLLAASSCSRKPKIEFPLVQKYTTTAGDLFYFRPGDGQFVLLERRKALAVAVAPEPDIQAYSYGDKITVSRPQGEMLHNTVFVEKISAQRVLAITPDGRYLAGGDANGAVTIWDIAAANITLHLDVPGPIQCFAFSRDGNWLAIGLAKPSGEPTDTVWVYEIHSNGPHRSFGRGSVPALAWSADGRWLAAGLDDGSVLISETAGSSEPKRIILSTSPITALDLHPSGLFLASAHADKRVLLCKLPAGERLFSFEPALPPNPLFPRVIERVAFDGNGTHLAAAYAEGDFRIWDTSDLAALTQ